MAGQYNYQILVDARLLPGTGTKLGAQLGKLKVNPKAVSGMKEMNKQAGLFGQNIGDVLGKIAMWTVLTKILFGTVRAFKDGVKAVIELNTQLLVLRKTTDMTNQELAQFTKEAMSVGDAVAGTTNQVIEAAGNFTRFGFSAKKALDLAKQALIMVNVADGITDVSDAASILISTMKGFEIPFEEVEHINDVINELGNRFASSSGDIADGYRRISAVMKQGNVRIE